MAGVDESLLMRELWDFAMEIPRFPIGNTSTNDDGFSIAMLDDRRVSDFYRICPW